MNPHLKPENLIEQVREVTPYMGQVFMEGGCWRMFCILRTVWPQAKPWYCGDHVITEIDGHFYDIRGRLRPRDRQGYHPLTMPGDRRLFSIAHRWWCSVHRLVLSLELTMAGKGEHRELWPWWDERTLPQWSGIKQKKKG